MARFKDYNYDQDKLPVRFDRQILPGSFEYNLSYLVEHELDLSIFEHRYHNDETGRPAYDPAILLKIIILAYARGVATSRKIEQLCRENVTFMAISADTQPHYTTLAYFVSSNSEQIQQFLDSHEERTGISGKPVKSNITDPESAKMKTSHGVIQGYRYCNKGALEDPRDNHVIR